MKNSLEEFKAKMREDQTPTSVLIRRAKEAAVYRNEDDNALADKYWHPIRVMHCRADDEVIIAAGKLITNADPESRCLGANILAQVHIGEETKAPEAAEMLVNCLERETEPAVLKDLVYALGHTPDSQAGPRLIELARHGSSSIRHAVAYALPVHEKAPGVIATLVTLTKDPESEVRDWATFGLGSQIEADSPEIREALLERLTDEVDDVRGEAICGLARLGEIRVIPALLKELEFEHLGKLSEWHLLVEAAEESVAAAERSNDPDWLPLLLRIEEIGLIDQARVQAAVNRCRPT